MLYVMIQFSVSVLLSFYEVENDKIARDSIEIHITNCKSTAVSEEAFIAENKTVACLFWSPNGKTEGLLLLLSYVSICSGHVVNYPRLFCPDCVYRDIFVSQ